MKLILSTAIMLAAFGPQASAASIQFVTVGSTGGSFDVLVEAQNLFAGRDASTDGIISYGFDVNISNSLLTLSSVTSGPLFDAPATEPGAGVFGAASGFGIFSPVDEPLTLATLHFTRVGSGASTITINSDLSNPFQGLQFVNAPFAESIAGTVAAGVPEPGTMAAAAFGLAALACLRRRGYKSR